MRRMSVILFLISGVILAGCAPRSDPYEDSLRAAIKNPPQRLRSALELAIELRANNRTKEAKELYQRIRLQHPESLSAINGLAKVNIQQNNKAEAIRLWESIVEKTDGKSDKYNSEWRAEALARLRQYR